MKVKTSELTGEALDWAVAKCEGKLQYWPMFVVVVEGGGWEEPCKYSTNWSQGGPLIEREIFKLFRNVSNKWTAQVKQRVSYYSPTYDADIGIDRGGSMKAKPRKP